LRRYAKGVSNISALETLAKVKELQGDTGGSFKAWKKAALLGGAEGQFKIGEIFYKGSGNQGVDGEESLFWLTRAVKVGAVTSCSPHHVIPHN
jgi:TPR repeat protein